MARMTFRDVGGGRRRGYARLMTSAFCLLLISTMVVGCNLNDPASPNAAGDLTGQTTNQQFTFTGTIGVTSFTATVAADDMSTVTITAVVEDNSGNPIPNLTTVTFNTDIGGFVVVDATGNIATPRTATAPTFNGLAQVEFQSVDRVTGTASIVASIGSSVASTKVQLERAVINGTLSLAFGANGGGATTLSGVATGAAPLDATVGVTAFDVGGDPIIGGTVHFSVISDTTGEGAGTKHAEWVAGTDTLTGATGDAVNVLRVFGAGDVVIQARLIDPTDGSTIATSNRIILTTKTAYLVELTFADLSTSFGSGPTDPSVPYSVGLIATVTDTEGNAQEGLTVRFSVESDTTEGGATLSTSVGITDVSGRITSQLNVPDTGAAPSVTSTVSVVAEVVDSAGTVLATSNVVIATGTP